MSSTKENFSLMHQLKKLLEESEEGNFVDLFDTSLIFDDLERIINRCASEPHIKKETVDSLLDKILNNYSEKIVLTEEEI